MTRGKFDDKLALNEPECRPRPDKLLRLVSALDLSERKKKVLAAVIDEYIGTAEPVGSKSVSEKSGFNLSPATIRNELAELTAAGYLEQPHTSAGRIPTPAGYRLYVNELMEKYRLPTDESERINRDLDEKLRQLDKLLADIGNLTSELTEYPALSLAAPSPPVIKRFDLIYIDAHTFIIVAMLTGNAVRTKLVRLPISIEQSMIQKLATLSNANFTGVTEDMITPTLISSSERAANDTKGFIPVIAGFAIEILSGGKAAEAYISGGASLLRLPEYRDSGKAHKVLSWLSEKDHLLRLPRESETGDVKVLIGPENVAEELRDSSVILVGYNAGDNIQGLIGVVGPTRMDYSKLAAKLSCIASGLGRVFETGGEAARGFDKLMIKGDDVIEQT